MRKNMDAPGKLADSEVKKSGKDALLEELHQLKHDLE